MKSIKHLSIAILLGVSALFTAQAQMVEVTQNVAAGTHQVWTPDNEYLLTQIIYVEPGASLTILPGTVIRGRASPAGEFNPGALVVSKGAKIFANGTPSAPIVFTAEFDLGLGDGLPYGAMNKDTRGQWGGVVILGDAPTNLQPGSGNRFVEGLPENELSEFGGNNPDDSSGSFSYVSIMHGGAVIGADNELNGLTLAGVGRGTNLHHIEIYANLDDGIEWFGGTCNVKYAVVAYCGDDSLDTDYGWNGSVQFAFVIQSDVPDNGDQGAEQDGGQDADDDEPFGMPQFYNVTMIGDGFQSADGGTRAAIWRDNAANGYTNSIFTDFSGSAFAFESRAAVTNSYDRLLAGDLKLRNNIVGVFGTGNTWEQLVRIDDQNDGHLDLNAALNDALAIIADGGNVLANPRIAFISRDRAQALNPRASNPAVTSDLFPVDVRDPFLKQTSYKGAFDPSADVPLWTDGWSALYRLGYTAR